MIFLKVAAYAVAAYIVILGGYIWSQRIRFNANYSTIRWELLDLKEVLEAATTTNPEDAKRKIAYCIEELDRLIPARWA
jgi:hypothetical protein